MAELQLGGIEVCASWLTQRSFRAAYCDFLLPITARNKKTMLAKFAREGALGRYSGLRVSGISDLSFLQDFPLLLYLEVIDSKRVNTRQLDGLTNLRGLRIESPGAGIDFACFPELEVFVGDWHADNSNISRARELRQLRAWQFNPRSADLSTLAGATRLEWLQLTQTNLTSLAGVELLEDLRYLEIAYTPKLCSLDALGNPDVDIREFSLNKAKNITSYQPIAAIKRLRRLKLSSCSPMPDLKWTLGMRHLDFFSFVETNVENGDLSPLLQLPNLNYAGFSDKRHYNIKFAEMNKQLNQRNQSRSLN